MREPRYRVYRPPWRFLKDRQPVHVELQFRRQMGSEISHCNVAARWCDDVSKEVHGVPESLLRVDFFYWLLMDTIAFNLIGS